jgi:hypothetical protein
MTRALIFKSSWGWMAVAESRAGLAAIVLPQTSKGEAASTAHLRLLFYGKRASN